jgi:hypothetical protein
MPDGSTLLLTIPDVAAELRWSKRSVDRALRAGTLALPVIYLGDGSPRVRRSDLEMYLQRAAASADDAKLRTGVVLRSRPRRRSA